MKHATRIYQLFAIVLVALLWIPLARGQGNDNSRYIPAPLPERQWVGKTGVNYTELHNEWAPVLSCMFIPVGVLGSFYRFILICLNVGDVVKLAMKLDNEETQPFSLFMSGCLTLGCSIFTTMQAFKTRTKCEGEHNFSVLRAATDMDIAAGIITGISGALVVLAAWSKEGSLGLAMLCNVFTLFIFMIQGPTILFSVTIAAGITKTYFTKRETVSLGAALVVYVPQCIAALILIAIGGCAINSDSAPGAMFPAALLGAFAIPLSAIGNLLLGKIMGDPWGRYLMRVVWGKISAGITSAGPVLSALFGFC